MSTGDALTNPTAEAALLGALLLDNRLIMEVADRVREPDFGDRLHGRIFTALMKFAAAHKRADCLTLRPLFVHDSDALGGDYLDQLVENPAVAMAASSLADQVADMARRRKAREVLEVAMKALHSDLDRKVDEIISQVDATAFLEEGEDNEFLDGGDMIGLVEERDERICNDPGAASLVCNLINEITNLQLETQTYNIVAGRPGMGKSALAQSASLGFAMAGEPGCYVNLEMKDEHLGLRVAADAGHAMNYRLTHAHLKKGGLIQADREDLADIKRKLKLLPIRFVRMKSQTDIRKIWSRVVRQKALFEAAGKKMRWVVIDYMGLIGASDSAGIFIDDDRKRINVVSRMLKSMAEDLDLCVIALAQLSRGVEQRQNKRPMLSDLKESGNLEQDADSVTMVYREEYYLKDMEPKKTHGDQPKNTYTYEDWMADMAAARGKLDMILAKNRHGASGTRQGKFLGDYVAVRSSDFNPESEEALLF